MDLDDDYTLAEWFDHWWPTVTDERSATRARDERNARTQFLRAFGEVHLDDLDHDALQAWVTGLTDPDGAALAPAVVHRTVQTLDRCLEAAVDEYLIATNPAAGLALPSIAAQPMRFLTDDELWRLVGSIDGRFRAFVLLGGFCGLRLGELLALRWRNVHLEERRVNITETLLEGGGLQIGPPRSKAAVRAVPLPDFVAHELAHLAEGVLDPNALVFPSPDGQPQRPTVFRRTFWLPAVDSAGLSTLGVHDLRSTAVSIWISEGASAELVAKLAGHTSAAVVLELYGELFANEDQRLVAALERRASARLTPQP